jgi:hypothetical protein
MERINIFKVFFIFFILIYIFNNFFTETMITGLYVSNNNQSNIEGPNRVGEKLLILEGNKFKSDTWGKGNYELKYSLNGTRIHLTYNYQYGKTGYEIYINRSYFLGKPQLILNRDLEIYFEKIK